MYDEQNVEENVKNALFSSTLYKMKNIFSFVFLLFFFFLYYFCYIFNSKKNIKFKCHDKQQLHTNAFQVKFL